MTSGFDYIFSNLSNAVQRELGVQIRLRSEHAPILQNWAAQENRALEDVLDELIANAIQQRIDAESMIERWAQLTRREREVVALFSIDKSRGEIAEILTIEHNTVKAHLRNAVQHLDCESTREMRQKLLHVDFGEWVGKNIHLPA
ncbi:MAG: LuxR family transcriptional regulator [Chloroflexi bacterium]|nr:MAG: LuxR family transcriptional regulator [Chloroflexota bacterium]MBL1196814.1 LuxR family transcriptional regulator [Chloroflexota bacterium]NOH14109.1 LuxR family transcriptional regulator [Chloroflexota bacterium]